LFRAKIQRLGLLHQFPQIQDFLAKEHLNSVEFRHQSHLIRLLAFEGIHSHFQTN